MEGERKKTKRKGIHPSPEVNLGRLGVVSLSTETGKTGGGMALCEKIWNSILDILSLKCLKDV